MCVCVHVCVGGKAVVDGGWQVGGSLVVGGVLFCQPKLPSY